MKKHYKFEIDCANCAAKVEDAIKKIDGVNNATVSFMTQKLTLDADDARFDEILQKVVAAAKKIEPDCELSRTLFPLGNLEKPAVRALAEAHGLINAQKRDSQDICFVPDGDYVGFITRCVGHESPTGPFVDQEGRVLGQHKGFIRYTKGQHKGLDLAIEPPLYVLRKDPADHAVYLGHNEDLFTSELIAGDWNWISIPALTAPMTVTVKTRYSQREAEAVAEPLSGGQVRLRFREPQRAVTPGQFVVLYDGDAVVGGGVILE